MKLPRPSHIPQYTRAGLGETPMANNPYPLNIVRPDWDGIIGDALKGGANIYGAYKKQKSGMYAMSQRIKYANEIMKASMEADTTLDMVGNVDFPAQKAGYIWDKLTSYKNDNKLSGYDPSEVEINNQLDTWAMRTIYSGLGDSFQKVQNATYAYNENELRSNIAGVQGNVFEARRQAIESGNGMVTPAEGKANVTNNPFYDPNKTVAGALAGGRLGIMESEELNLLPKDSYVKITADTDAKAIYEGYMVNLDMADRLYEQGRWDESAELCLQAINFMNNSSYIISKTDKGFVQVTPHWGLSPEQLETERRAIEKRGFADNTVAEVITKDRLTVDQQSNILDTARAKMNRAYLAKARAMKAQGKVGAMIANKEMIDLQYIDPVREAANKIERDLQTPSGVSTPPLSPSMQQVRDTNERKGAPAQNRAVPTQSSTLGTGRNPRDFSFLSDR